MSILAATGMAHHHRCFAHYSSRRRYGAEYSRHPWSLATRIRTTISTGPLKQSTARSVSIGARLTRDRKLMWWDGRCNRFHTGVSLLEGARCGKSQGGSRCAAAGLIHCLNQRVVCIDPLLTAHVKRNVEEFSRAVEPGPMPWQREKTKAAIRLPVPAQALENIEPSYDRFTGNMKSGLIPISDAVVKPDIPRLLQLNHGTSFRTQKIQTLWINTVSSMICVMMRLHSG